SGVKNPHLFTHLFHEGSILGTKRVDYDPAADPRMVRALMQEQHKSMLRELKEGKLDGRIRAFFAARGEQAELHGAGPMESEPVEAPPVPQSLREQESELAAAPAAPAPARLAPAMEQAEDAPVITLAPPPRAPQPSPGLRPASSAPAWTQEPALPQPSSLDRRPGASLAPPPARAQAPEDDGPVITLAPPPGRAPAEPAPPRPADPQAGRPGTLSARRIWAKRGGTTERPFDDSGPASTVGAGAP